jgi:25S rRNA (adenine2142-N1)-methyltransferase
MTNVKKRVKLKSLSQGRPRTVKPVSSLSSKATRTLIRKHHTLEKQRAKALADGDEAKAAAIAKQIELHGGLESYQHASLIGQSNDRGGDSSKILMEWFAPILPALKEHAASGQPIRMLEVGALSVTNACSKSHLFEMERIDLRSQAEGIKEEDFMERPLPRDDKDQFDIISLSLVLNYVPDAIGRGKMLERTLKFLKARQYLEGGLRDFLPSLYLVLPAPCVTNSRYMDESKLEAIMESLGYVRVKRKLSNKLVYYLWRAVAPVPKRTTAFKKVEIRSGKNRNNFAIVLA